MGENEYSLRRLAKNANLRSHPLRGNANISTLPH